MTYSMRLVHLDVGQGTGTFLEVHETVPDGKKYLRHTALFDFGSDHDTKEAGGPSVEYVVAVLKTMTIPTLDAVVLSHSDTDHISLLTKLLKAFKPFDKDDPKPNQLRVLYSAHGGAHQDYEKRGFNVLDELKKYMRENKREVDQKSRSVPREYSSFERENNPAFREIGPVKLYLLVGNHPNGKAGSKPKRNAKGVLDAFSLNTVSLVSVLSYAFVQMVETGDATGATLRWANTILRGYDDIKNVINDVKGMTVPHHGSSVTVFDFGKASSGSATPESNLESFLKWIKAKSYTVSASETNSHRHPDASLLKYFWDGVLDDDFWVDDLITPYHYYTAYFRAESFSRMETVGNNKPVKVRWPPDWPDKIVWKADKKPKGKKKPKKPPKKRKVAVPVEADRLTVRMRRPVYSSVYYSANAAAWEYVGVPPSTIVELPKLVVPKGEEKPPLGVAWVYSTTFDDDTHSTTKIIQRVNRDSLIRLRRAMDAGVPPDELPDVPAEELWPDESESESAPIQPLQPRQPVPALSGLARSQHAPMLHHQHQATIYSAGPRPDARPPARAAVPSPRSRLRRIEVVR